MTEPSDISKAFAKSLRHYRHRKQISQDDLALRVGLERSYISVLERALKSPSLNTMHAIARQLDVPLKELIGHAEAQLKN